MPTEKKNDIMKLVSEPKESEPKSELTSATSQKAKRSMFLAG